VKRLSKSKSDGKVSMFGGIYIRTTYKYIAVMNKEGRVLRNSKIDNNLKQIDGFFNDIDDKAHVFMHKIDYSSYVPSFLYGFQNASYRCRRSSLSLISFRYALGSLRVLWSSRPVPFIRLGAM
jgi:hypothetical protein